MSEYTENLGRRVELREERGQLIVEIDALRSDLRGALNPILDAVDLDGTKIGSLSIALSRKLGRLSEVNAKLAKIQELIGR